MSDFNGGSPRFGAVARPDMAVDAGLRAFMLGVYNKVALGLLLSAGLAWFTGTYEPVQRLLWAPDATGRMGFTILGFAVAWAPVAILLFRTFARQVSPRASGIIYWAIVTAIGASLGVVFSIYAKAAVFETFLVTAVAFGGLSLVGYTTKRDLSGFGSFLIMGVIGLLVAMVANMFFHSGLMEFVINLLGVGIFAGLTAFHTQRTKMTYYQLGGDKTAMSLATDYGALSLYLDFINMFQFLLYFVGGGSRR